MKKLINNIKGIFPLIILAAITILAGPGPDVMEELDNCKGDEKCMRHIMQREAAESDPWIP